MLRAMLGATVTVVIIVAVVALLVWREAARGPELVSHVQASDGTVYALYAHHPAFGDYDPAWFVYEFPSVAVMNDAAVSSSFGSGALFETYEEGGDHSSDEALEIVHDRFVVVSRAGILHSLYDRSCRQVLVHEQSPWHAAALSELAPEKRTRAYLEWKLTHLDQPIEGILASPPPRCAA